MRVPPRVSTSPLACLKALIAILALTAALSVPSTAGAYSIQCDDDGIACIADTGYAGEPFWDYGVDVKGNNCTTYVAYRLSENGLLFPGGFGDAGDWADRAAERGFEVDDSPEVGSVAHWTRGRFAPVYGHVAYVERVLPGAVVLSESSYEGGSRRWKVRRSDWEWPTGFIHMRDLTSGSVSIGPEAARTRLFSGFGGSDANPTLRIECPPFGTACVSSITGWVTILRRGGGLRRLGLGVRIFELEPGGGAERAVPLPRALRKHRRAAKKVILTLRTDTLEVRSPTFVRLRLQ